MNLTTRISKYVSAKDLVSLLTGGLMFAMSTQKYINERYSLLERATVGILLLFVILYFSKTKLKRIVVPIPLALLVVVMGFSITQLPASFIFKDYVAYLLLSIFSVLVISVFEIQTVINGIAIASALLMITNIGLITLTGIDSTFTGGRLVGSSYGSNTLAASLVITAPGILFFQTKKPRVQLFLRIVLLGTLGTLIFLTAARTAWITFLVVLIAWAIYKMSQKVKFNIFWIIIPVFVLGIIALLNKSTVLNVLGKNSTLDGRTPLWHAYLDKIIENPILGYGWSYQTRVDMPLGNYIAQTIGHPLTNAHNDFLNWWATTGFIGVLLFVACLIMILSSILIKTAVNCEKYWLFISGLSITVSGLAELTSMYADGWMLFSLCVASAGVLARSSGQLKSRYLNWVVPQWNSKKSRTS